MTNSNDNILEMKNITKLYPGVAALNSLSFSIKRGEIHAIVGENGAGKSTLIKTITGCIEPTDGELLFNGEVIRRYNPLDSIKRGIGAVYQEFNLVPELTVYENIYYGRELKKGFFIDKTEMIKESNKVLNTLGIDIDPNQKVKNLTIAYQQIVEIAKSVSRDVKMLILDEPSAPLTGPEISSMFSVIKKLKAKGVTVLYISHRLEEIFEISDRVSVMRDGQYINTLETSSSNREELIRLMVGRELTNDYPNQSTATGDSILEIEGISNSYLKNVSFSLKKGEILGLGGLVGAGRTEVARAIFGADKIEKGTIKLNGHNVAITSPEIAIKYGIGLIPEDRKRQGALLGLSIGENIVFSSLKGFSKYGWINKNKTNSVILQLMKSLQIKAPSENQLVKNLSGGNQQKVVLAKWLATNCSILIFDEPTRGIDVGAKQEIYKLMRLLTDQGISIIMISSELPELIGMSDRIVVMYEGRVTGELYKEEATQEKVLDLASANSEHSKEIAV